jgi:hypothetical protein
MHFQPLGNTLTLVTKQKEKAERESLLVQRGRDIIAPILEEGGGKYALADCSLLFLSICRDGAASAN